MADPASRMDGFAACEVNRSDPANDSMLIEPADVELPWMTRAIRCQTGGTLDVMTAAGQRRTLWFNDGETRAIRITRVYAASSTVSGIEVMP